jgi:hypothetical protein
MNSENQEKLQFYRNGGRNARRSPRDMSLCEVTSNLLTFLNLVSIGSEVFNAVFHWNQTLMDGYCMLLLYLSCFIFAFSATVHLEVLNISSFKNVLKRKPLLLNSKLLKALERKLKS